ncbi:MAG TPA: hypothetical protein VFE62_11420 [Gemmataceae bacterium]|nr:hypothetical protein [Gemmataceae bacterium]
MKRTAKLPSHLRRLFWEYDFARLSWRTDRDLIMGRILAEGHWEAIRWLRRKVSAEDLRDWIIACRGRGLDPRRLRFFELIFDLPHRQVNAWLADPSRRVWEGR